MNKSRSLLAVSLGACLMLAGALVMAQPEQTPPDMDPAVMQEMWAKMMPGEQHKHLQSMVGSWQTKQKVWMEPGAAPLESEGVCEYAAILGGRYIQGNFKGSWMGQPFEGFSIDGYDNYKGQYFSIWLDSMGTGYYLSHGPDSPDGKSYTQEGTMFDPMSGQDLATRSVTRIVDKDRVEFTIYRLADGQEIKSMEMSYTRR